MCLNAKLRSLPIGLNFRVRLLLGIVFKTHHTSKGADDSPQKFVLQSLSFLCQFGHAVSKTHTYTHMHTRTDTRTYINSTCTYIYSYPYAHDFTNFPCLVLIFVLINICASLSLCSTARLA